MSDPEATEGLPVHSGALALDAMNYAAQWLTYAWPRTTCTSESQAMQA